MSIAIYDDRIEIDNSGSLFHGIQVDDLKKSHKSYLRNPLIARAFYYCGLIEQWGQGIQKMTDLCGKANLPEPEFISNKFGFQMVFRAEIKAPGPKRLSGTKWSLRQHEIYELIVQRQKISIQELEAKFPDASKRTLQRDLAELKQGSYVSSRGKAQSILWFVNTRG